MKNVLSKIHANKFWHNTLKNSLQAVIGEGGSSLINLVIIYLSIKLLNADGYAILTLAQNYMLIMDTLINMQCWRAVIKYGEEARSKNDTASYLGYIKLGSIYDLVTAVLSCVVSLALTLAIGHIYNWSDTLILASQVFSLEIIFLLLTNIINLPKKYLEENDKQNKQDDHQNDNYSAGSFI